MIAVDTNVLVYAHREGFPLHRKARDAVVALAGDGAAWGIPVFCLGELIRIITHPRLFDPPHTSEDACDAMTRLLASPGLRLLGPGPRYWALFDKAIRESGATGNLVFDAQIVAVCRENGVSALLTEDRDYARFPGFPVEHLHR